MAKGISSSDFLHFLLLLRLFSLYDEREAQFNFFSDFGAEESWSSAFERKTINHRWRGRRIGCGDAGTARCS